MSIDLTDAKASNMLGNLTNMVSRYELELDVSFKKSTNDMKVLDKFAENIRILPKNSFALRGNTSLSLTEITTNH